MKKKILVGFGILVILFLWAGISIYPDWLWFENLDFSPVFLDYAFEQIWLWICGVAALDDHYNH